WNFKDVVDALLQHEAVTIVQNQAAFQGTLIDWLEDPPLAETQGERAQRFVLDQRGATLRTLALIAPLLAGAQSGAQDKAA
ncbi:MAG TPA: 3-deoxy-D-manno-octulosonic acid transferase, partial [Gimesia maris]|nr:3-deoxy-D-manno-octulosonic acid transferase [Gimesia maris]